MTQAAPALVRKEVVVDAPLEHAFTRFTAGFGDFKPPEHNLLGTARVETIFEPQRRRETSTTAPRTAASAACAHPGVRAADSGGVQLGHRAYVATRTEPRPDK